LATRTPASARSLTCAKHALQSHLNPQPSDLTEELNMNWRCNFSPDTALGAYLEAEGGPPEADKVAEQGEAGGAARGREEGDGRRGGPHGQRKRASVRRLCSVASYPRRPGWAINSAYEIHTSSWPVLLVFVTWVVTSVS
jgi:hypothetical protein